MNRRNFIVESISGIAAVGMVGNLQGHQKIDKNGVFVSKFLMADHLNGNKRIYSKKICENIVKNFKPVMGQIGPRKDGLNHLSQASHYIHEVYFDDPYLMAKIEILNTDQGRILKEMMSLNSVEFRSAGKANDGWYDESGIMIVSDSYQMFSIDALPSNIAASL